MSVRPGSVAYGDECTFGAASPDHPRVETCGARVRRRGRTLPRAPPVAVRRFRPLSPAGAAGSATLAGRAASRAADRGAAQRHRCRASASPPPRRRSVEPPEAPPVPPPGPDPPVPSTGADPPVPPVPSLPRRHRRLRGATARDPTRTTKSNQATNRNLLRATRRG